MGEFEKTEDRVILRGFVDDSGSGGGIDRGNIFALAGFVGSPERWDKFSNEWTRSCDQEPPTPDFHIQTDIRLLNKDRSVRWTGPQRDARIKELVDLTKARAQYRVESVLAWPNYDRLVKGKIPPELDSPYLLCFYNVIISFAEFMDKAHIDGVVDWVFDDQGRTGKDAIRWYEFIKATIAPRVQNRLGCKPIFRNDRSTLPLKACDIWAWQIRRHLDKDQPQGIEHNDCIDSLLGLHGVSNVIEGEHLEEFVENIAHGVMLKSSTTFFLPLQMTAHLEGRAPH
jgi:hypothetical protein